MATVGDIEVKLEVSVHPASLELQCTIKLHILYAFYSSVLQTVSLRLHILTKFVFQAQMRLRWSRRSVLAFGTKVRGITPDRSRRIFQGEKILSTPSFRTEVKPFVPCHRFTACKRSLNITWKSGIFRQNSSAVSHPSSSSFHYQGLWWRHLAVQVGTTKDQGVYNKPSTAGYPGALAAGTLLQYNTIKYNTTTV